MSNTSYDAVQRLFAETVLAEVDAIPARERGPAARHIQQTRRIARDACAVAVLAFHGVPEVDSTTRSSGRPTWRRRPGSVGGCPTAGARHDRDAGHHGASGRRAHSRSQRPASQRAVVHVEMLLPFVDQGYSRWVAHGGADGHHRPHWFGWVLATAVVAAFADVLRRGG